MLSENTEKKIVAIIGDVMIDRYLTGRVDRISPEAPVPILLQGSNRAVAGGAANVAANVIALGCAVRLVGVVGADQDADDLRQILRDTGISTSSLVVDPERPTICKTRVVSGRQQFFRIDREFPGHPPLEIQERIIHAARHVIAEADIVVLSDYAKGLFSEHVLRQTIDAARSTGKLILVDPKRRTFEVYRGANVIKPNASELSAATGLPCSTDSEIEAAAGVLAAQFDGTLLVTRSESGMSLVRPGQPVRHIKTTALEVADVSGAGDTALAALAVSVADGTSIEEAASISNIAAGIAVSKLGTSIVSRKELNRGIAIASVTVYHPGSLATKSTAVEMASVWRRMGERVVFTNGCFDLIHAGHIELLSFAASQGDRLIVALNSDSSVRSLKGASRPIQTETDRARIVGALRAVDLVVLFDEATPLSLIEAISPDVLIKGADYNEEQVVGADFVKSRGGRVALFPLVEGRSSTMIVERLRS
jgi:D-beta-D-heptose 7-phosphate kinase / D-beta-D-heptose 1-phosphate adenosyltransferase